VINGRRYELGNLEALTVEALALNLPEAMLDALQSN
jgi:hypothetical protein